MTIQIPNVGTGVPADQTGDSPWAAMKKVADNFSNQAHAASRLVGEGTGNVMQAGAFGIGKARSLIPNLSLENQHIDGFGSQNIGTVAPPDAPLGDIGKLLSIGSSSWGSQMWFSYFRSKVFFRSKETDAPYETWREFYHTGNATKDSNGFIKAASPVIQVYADKIELNDDAKQQNITFTKNDIGDYTISGTSGLSTDGWYIELPLDLNGNPKVAVTLTETDGTIELKCYKRTFNMTTFVFEPDLDSPIDVPDGRWIDIRLNEIEREAPTMPDVDSDKKD